MDKDVLVVGPVADSAANTVSESGVTAPDIRRPDMRARRIGSPAGPLRRVAVWLAVAAIPLLAYQVYTLARWLADGPSQVSTFRDSSGVSLYAARFLETAVIVTTFIVLWRIVAECRRTRRFTFDAVIFVALVLTIFWDTIVTVQHPIWLYSSNWINLNDWWEHGPLVTNAAAGTTAMPVLMLLFTYTGFTFAFIAGINIVMRHAKARWERLSNLGLAAVTLVFAYAVCIPCCYALNALHLWSLGDVPPFLFQASDFRVSFVEISYGAFYFTALACLRYFKDDNGLAITERGLERLGSLRHPARILSTTAAFNLAVILCTIPVMLAGSQAVGYPDLPDQLVRGVCDTSATSHTTPYGPCPGLLDERTGTP